MHAFLPGGLVRQTAPVLAGLLLFSLATIGGSMAQEMVHELEVTPTAELALHLSAGTRWVAKARPLRGVPPILHLVAEDGAELARSTSGPTEATLSWRVDEDRSARLILLPMAGGAPGVCDLQLGGGPWRRAVPYGGRTLRLAGLRVGEEIETVRLPLGAGPEHRLYFLDEQGRLERRVAGGGTAGAAHFTVRTAAATTTVIVAVSSAARPGRLRLLRNDVALPGHDGDGDGLGRELEAALGTCSRLGEIVDGFDSSLAVDPRDTDGDGISDGWEVLGRRDRKPHQPLPLWGADPRHKDLFIEVDFMRRTAAENESGLEHRMPVKVARRFWEVYGDVLSKDPKTRRRHAEMLRNPDGKPGIAVHLDIGRRPAREEDTSIYGDWGGYNGVDAVQKADGTYRGVHARDAWRRHLARARLGIFRYALAYGTGGGQAGPGFAASYNMSSAFIAIHETGHTFGLGHSGPMGGYVDVNGKPNYPSVMNYAFGNAAGFADGSDAFAPLNNRRLTEWKAVDPSNALYLDILARRFRYWVDREHGHVDWNRDGEIAPAGKVVRAYANFRPGASCEFTRYNQVPIGESKAARSPSLCRLGKRLYAFFIDLETGALRYAISTSRWDSAVPLVPPAYAGEWGPARSAGVDASRGVDALRLRDAATGEIYLLVATIDRHGVLRTRRLTVREGVESWTPPAALGAVRFDGEPSLAHRTERETSALLLARGPGGTLWMGQVGSDAKPLILARGKGGGRILLGDDTSPAVHPAALGSPHSTRKLYGAFADPDARLRLFALDAESGTWHQTGLIGGRRPPLRGRPAMAWVPPGPVSAHGRLYLLYIERPRGRQRRQMVRMRMSYVDVGKERGGGAETRSETVGLDSPFDNVWLEAYGVDLLFEPGVDTNLRAALVRRARRGDRKLDFRPNADALNDFTYANANDWEVLRVGLCREVVNPGGLVPNPIRAPSR